jgi:hypothetical protein
MKATKSTQKGTESLRKVFRDLLSCLRVRLVSGYLVPVFAA